MSHPSRSGCTSRQDNQGLWKTFDCIPVCLRERPVWQGVKKCFEWEWVNCVLKRKQLFFLGGFSILKNLEKFCWSLETAFLQLLMVHATHIQADFYHRSTLLLGVLFCQQQSWQSDCQPSNRLPGSVSINIIRVTKVQRCWQGKKQLKWPWPCSIKEFT